MVSPTQNRFTIVVVYCNVWAGDERKAFWYCHVFCPILIEDRCYYWKTCAHVCACEVFFMEPRGLAMSVLAPDVWPVLMSPA